MKIIANNKKAFHDYFIEDKFEAGLELFGWEVKSARASEVNLLDSFVWFLNGEAFLKNSHFSKYKDGFVAEQDPTRDRKLLLKKTQIEKLHSKVKAKGYTCVVTKIYLSPKGLFKAEVALARGKHTYDKKQTLKEKDLRREAENEIKQKRNP
jgi:SsrA-binding protein